MSTYAGSYPPTLNNTQSKVVSTGYLPTFRKLPGLVTWEQPPGFVWLLFCECGKSKCFQSLSNLKYPTLSISSHFVLIQIYIFHNLILLLNGSENGLSYVVNSFPLRSETSARSGIIGSGSGTYWILLNSGRYFFCSTSKRIDWKNGLDLGKWAVQCLG
jgi:hypothetical protein